MTAFIPAPQNSKISSKDLYLGAIFNFITHYDTWELNKKFRNGNHIQPCPN